MRKVKADNIGELVTVRGIITRATEVKPLMSVATYTCDQCGSESYQPIRHYGLFEFVMSMHAQCYTCTTPSLPLTCTSYCCVQLKLRMFRVG